MKSELVFEIWKPVPGYDDYEVSSFGRVRSLYKNKILSISRNKNGYCAIILYKRGKLKRFLIHRLVWTAFNGIIPEGMEVNHINEVKTDNSIWNLNLMTHTQNVNYLSNIRRMSESKKNGKQSKKVYQYTLDGVLVRVWQSVNEAGRNGFCVSSIVRCCQGKLRQHKGFLWFYVPLNNLVQN